NAYGLEEYGGITVEMMDRLRRNTQQRGYAVMQNYAVRGALGVGCAMLDTANRPVLAMSVSALIERMTVKRQGEVARLLRHELDSLRRMFFGASPRHTQSRGGPSSGTRGAEGFAGDGQGSAADAG